jgi:hypothetical protein
VPPRQAVSGVVHTDVRAKTHLSVCSTWYDATALVLRPLWTTLDGLGDVGNSLVACPARKGIAQETIESWSCLPAPGCKIYCSARADPFLTIPLTPLSPSVLQRPPDWRGLQKYREGKARIRRASSASTLGARP